jgi:hypothetical protein
MLYAATSMAQLCCLHCPWTRKSRTRRTRRWPRAQNCCACLHARRHPSSIERAPKPYAATSVCFLKALPVHRADYKWLPCIPRFRVVVIAAAQPHALAIFPLPYRRLEPTSPKRTMPHIPSCSSPPSLASHRHLFPLLVPSPIFNPSGQSARAATRVSEVFSLRSPTA